LYFLFSGADVAAQPPEDAQGPRQGGHPRVHHRVCVGDAQGWQGACLCILYGIDPIYM